jgi:hypothetical protein
LRIKTPIQKPAHFTHMKTMHKQTSTAGWVIPFFLFCFFGLPDSLWGPSWVHWGPTGPLGGPPGENLFFLSSLGLSEPPWAALTGPLQAHRKPPFWPSRVPHGPLAKSLVTPAIFGPACLGFLHKHGKSPDPPSPSRYPREVPPGRGRGGGWRRGWLLRL